MAKKQLREGLGKLLDAWTPPANAGQPVGCLATSFTFSPAFFEEECLSRFLHLETDAAEDGPLYLIEREEKLFQVACAAALVDQHHCKGPRSLRWDLLSARPSAGILHAKISLLCWSNVIRVIIASANLTEDGYRRNQEVFGVLDYHVDSKAPVSALKEVLDFLRLAGGYSAGGDQPPSPAITRWNGLLDRAWDAGRNWGVSDEQHARQPMRVRPVLLRPGAPDALTSLSQIWPGQSPPIWGYVISPFFDPPECPNRPAEGIWEIMRKRGEAEVGYCVVAEEVGKDTLAVQVPASVQNAQPSREGARTIFWRRSAEGNRPLHAKAIWLEDDHWAMYMVGSSNFTTPGLGLNRRGNLEANLVYTAADYDNGRRAYNKLCISFPDGDDIPNGVKLLFRSDKPNDDEANGDEVLLPQAFAAAIYDVKDGQPTLDLSFSGSPPSGWSLAIDNDIKVMSEDEWTSRGSPTILSLTWTQPRPPSGLWVRWTGSQGQAWWPVNIAAATSLPEPDELKDLSLDVLIEILTSARPLHQAMQAYLKRRHSSTITATTREGVESDPHRRVDTSQFLLQRTRRISWALSGLRQRLERPAATEASLQWRIHGPVGVMALARATQRECRSDAERAFLMAELVLELSRVQPQEAPGCLPAKKVKIAVRAAASQLRNLVPTIAVQGISNLNEYLASAFGEALG